jgi:hypothetical protein
MPFKDFSDFKCFVERGLATYTAIELHLPYVVEESNIEQAIKLVPEQWMDKFIADVYAFDGTKEWKNTEYPWGLPPARYSIGMALLRREFEIRTATRNLDSPVRE